LKTPPSLADTNCTPAGNASITVALDAGAGPRFSYGRRYVISAPAAVVSGACFSNSTTGSNGVGGAGPTVLTLWTAVAEPMPWVNERTRRRSTYGSAGVPTGRSSVSSAYRHLVPSADSSLAKP